MTKRTPESLFDNIAQDNEVLQLFKHHSLRVMYLSTLLAKKIGCYDEDLRIAAFLHDIGKMGIAKEILLKPGKLTTMEKTIVESHSHIGNVIVRKELGKLRPARFIRDHHEDWKGTGYPRGLIGEDISIQGRIIRICDSFDTMTYDMRNYKKQKMSHQQAFDELRRCSWSQFDGNLVEEFISLLQELELPENWYDTFNFPFIEKLFEKVENPADIL
ncbi:HD-GYP domain-containing protein [Virgibacillus senegalensis]|uniref:HD-GYP domain-containing protein n=1 Tax=Virgibacillus senegalensis TaxID=1499679 RepID=UPI00069F23F3|nr:HD domain-containing phosphohydrolase [Virgibacillus senegalensis]